MKAMSYRQWIADYTRRHNGVLLGKCKEATEEMCAAFPELTKVAGHVHCEWGKRGHFWATTADGTIVDPTRAQFPGAIAYEAWSPGQTVRVGRCMNCGADIWRESNDLKSVRREEICGEDCARALGDYYNDPSRRERLPE
jgi:hypothetical protein